MGGFFDPALMARTYRDPIAVFGLLVDISPILAIIFFGWGIDELVVFYWIENLIIGAGVLARLISCGVLGRQFSAIFLSVFFFFHYGMFCLVHGVFLFQFFGPNFNALPLFLILIVMWEAVLFATQFIAKRRYESDTPNEIMFSPYGRIVIVHLAIFGAAFSAEALGSPIGGAIVILVLDILWGVALALFRRQNAEKEAQTAVQS